MGLKKLKNIREGVLGLKWLREKAEESKRKRWTVLWFTLREELTVRAYEDKTFFLQAFGHGFLPFW